ncbi:hypothetical protein C9374_012247 [Naegleria lovaniensis]|uniref:Ketoreductase domain-containing protein n=1 Tax=Naegleria lovaniensis TaxID=51637 RepID=A0AA88GG23_NAELO|nr:uncharacterized protein C9374_012247 [Naegleria lovaniensis]KAG2373381.1 hypothetical protein C9374_012247 [Naegleria lovaniensis]
MSQQQQLFENQIVIITGAARGLGRSHALAFAGCGAYVVVQDIDEKASRETVEYLNKQFPIKTGVRAIASNHSITNPEGPSQIIEQALKSFPPQAKITVLVNNAGILRDKSFSNMTEEQWSQVYSVHLYGVFLMTRQVWNIFKKQQYGRVIFTTSAAGLYGNFGQANYSACKEALCGLARTLALESERMGNVCVNCVSPLAGTQILQQSNMEKEMLDSLKVEMVSPLVVFLSSSKCKENGQIYEAGGGVITKVRYERGVPFYCDTIQNALSVEVIEKNWEKINQFFTISPDANVDPENNGFERNPKSAAESFQNIIKHATKLHQKSATSTSSDSRESVTRDVTTTSTQQSSSTTTAEPKIVAGLKRAVSPNEVHVDGYKCSELFGRMVILFKEHTDLVGKFKVTYVFDLINDQNKNIKKQWTLNIKNKDDCGVYLGAPVTTEGDKVVDCVMTMTDSNCYKVMTGQISPQSAYMRGMVKVKGSIGLALKLTGLQKLLTPQPSL